MKFNVITERPDCDLSVAALTIIKSLEKFEIMNRIYCFVFDERYLVVAHTPDVHCEYFHYLTSELTLPVTELVSSLRRSLVLLRIN